MEGWGCVESQHLQAFEGGLRVEVGNSAVQVRSPRKWELLGGSEQGRRLKRLIDPGEQIAVDEQLLAQQGSEIGQAPTEAGPQLQVFEQEQGNQGSPDLNLQGVGARSVSENSFLLC